MTTVETFHFTSRRRALTRRIAKIVAAPVHFMLETGQFRSMARARSVDRGGRPLPMLTYPVIDFLQSIEGYLTGCDVLEFGCGQSTKWLAPRVRSLTGVEKNASFRDVLNAEFSGMPNVRIVGNEQPFAVTGHFDVIILDGEPRIDAGRFAPHALKPDGIIIFDNSDVQSLSAIPMHLHELGFARVDYFGYSPTGVRKQCTSVFFKSSAFFRLQRTIMPISQNSLTEKLQ